MTKNNQFNSVVDMLKASAGSDHSELIRKVDEKANRSRLIKGLVAQRLKHDISQAEMAQRLNCTQSKISKLENSIDEDVKLGDLCRYASASGLTLRISAVPDKLTPVDEIKLHAFKIKALLDRLVRLMEGDDNIDDSIAEFVCQEVPANMLKMFVKSISQIPEHVLSRQPFIETEDDFVCELDEPTKTDKAHDRRDSRKFCTS